MKNLLSEVQNWNSREKKKLHLANVRDFNKGLFGLPVFVQLQSDVSRIRWPSHVKNSQGHETWDQCGVMCRVQKQLPRSQRIWQVILNGSPPTKDVPFLKCLTCLGPVRFLVVSLQCWVIISSGGDPHTAASSPCHKYKTNIKVSE